MDIEGNTAVHILAQTNRYDILKMIPNNLI
jgi:hypothetical protein